MTHRSNSALALLASFAWACSSTDAAAPAGSKDAGSHLPGTGGSTSSGGSTGTGGAGTGGAPGSGGGAGNADAADPAFCGAGTAGAAGAVCVSQVHGRAIDESGAPFAAQQLVSACGAVQCNPGFTDASGKFTIPVGIPIVPGDYSVQVHDRVDLTAFYFRLPIDAKGPIIDVGDVRALPMPATGSELQVDRNGTPAQSVTSGDVTLDVPGNVHVRLDVESNLADNTTAGKGRAFRVLKIPDGFMKEYADPSLGFAAIYAMEPFECGFSTPNPDPVKEKYDVDVRLSFANSTNIAAGSAVDVMALGTYVYSDWTSNAGAPMVPAAFTKVAGAHVSADGTKIDMDPGEGVRYLTWVAVRKTP